MGTGQAAGNVVVQGGDASAGATSTGGSVVVAGGVGKAFGGDLLLSTATSTLTNAGSSGAVSVEGVVAWQFGVHQMLMAHNA